MSIRNGYPSAWDPPSLIRVFPSFPLNYFISHRMKTARIIITYECPRSCKGCCNKQDQFKHIQSFGALEHVREFDQVILTGGEPLLDPKRLIELISLIKHLNPTVEIIVYSALYRDNLAALLTVLYLVDGLTLTIHETKDIIDFVRLDDILGVVNMPKKKLRLNIFKQALICKLVSPRWDIKDNIEWIDNCPLPENETLFKL